MSDKRKTRYVLTRPVYLVVAAISMINTMSACVSGSPLAYLINAFVVAFGISVAFERDC